MQFHQRHKGERSGKPFSYLGEAGSAPDLCTPEAQHKRVVFFLGDYLSVKGPEIHRFLNLKSQYVERALGGIEVLDNTDIYTVSYNEPVGKVTKKVFDAAASVLSKENPYGEIMHKVSKSPALVGRSFHVLRYKQNPDVYFSQSAKQFAHEVLMPVIEQHCRAGLSHEEMLAAVKRDFNRITFVSDSYGGIFAREIANCLKRDIPRSFPKIVEPEIKSLLQSIVHVGLANVVDAEKEGDYTSVMVTGNHDMCHEFVTRGNWADTVPMAKFASMPKRRNLERGNDTTLTRHTSHTAEIRFDPAMDYEVNERVNLADGQRKAIKLMRENNALHDSLTCLMPIGNDNRHVDLTGLALRQAVTRPLDGSVIIDQILPPEEAEKILSSEIPAASMAK